MADPVLAADLDANGATVRNLAAPVAADHAATKGYADGLVMSGPAGATGPKGDKGDTGAAGAPGPTIDATTGSKGVVQLAGDLAGTAAAPSVPGLAGKASVSAPTTHTSDTGNPHAVTKAQVGLSAVTNDAQLKAAQLDTDGTLAANSDGKVPSQKAVKAYVDGAAGGSVAPGLWQRLDKVVLARGGTGTVASLTVPAGDWPLLRVRFVSVATSHSSARLLSLNVNNQAGAIWESDGIYHNKAFGTASGAAWGTNVSGAGNINTGTAPMTAAPFGAIWPEGSNRVNGELLLSQDDLLTTFRADLADAQPSSGGVAWRMITHGGAAYTVPITSIQISGYNLTGTFILEGLSALPAVLPPTQSQLDTDPTMAANSDLKVATQKAARLAINRQSPRIIVPAGRIAGGDTRWVGTKLTGPKGTTVAISNGMGALGMGNVAAGTLNALCINVTTAIAAGSLGDICCYRVGDDGFPTSLLWSQAVPLDTTGDITVTGLNLPIPWTGVWAFMLWNRGANAAVTVMAANSSDSISTQGNNGATSGFQLRPTGTNASNVIPPDLSAWKAQTGSGIAVLAGYSDAPYILGRAA